MEYKLTDADIDKCVEFAVNIYKSGPQTNRTTGEARALGKSIDDWAAGKASEMGVQHMLEQAGDKKLELDFDIYKPGQHADKPDIISVFDSPESKKREPKLWIEVKSVKYSNRWIGLSAEQLNTIRSRKKDSEVFLIYTASVGLSTEGTPDITAAFLSRALKPCYGNVFSGLPKEFSIRVLAVMTLDDLVQTGDVFKPGIDYVVETNIFEEEKNPQKNFHKEAFFGGGILNAVQGGSDYGSHAGGLQAPEGSLEIYRRDNKKSTSYYALALKDFELRSRVLGSYRLEKDKWYRLQIGRAGRNSSVYKESLWTALRNAQQKFGSEEHIKASLKAIMENI